MSAYEWARCRSVRLISAVIACVMAVSLVGCLEKKPVPIESEPASLETVQDRPDGSSSASSSASTVREEPQQIVQEEVLAEEQAPDHIEEAPAAGNLAREQLLAGFTALSQYPELPNGCEITSLAAVLNYYEYPVSKTTLSDSYLAKAPVGQANFYREFVGDPRDSDAYGCYSPVIVATANAYLSSIGSTLSAIDITGASPAELYSHIDAGTPVIVWATRYLEAGHYSVTWNVDGQALTWFTPEHCLVLVGYDAENRLVEMADPLEGAVVSYDMDLFESRFSDLGNQAVVIM